MTKTNPCSNCGRSQKWMTNGLCKRCWRKWAEAHPSLVRGRPDYLVARSSPPRCHPHRQYCARGLCGPCYREWLKIYGRPAKCCPSKTVYALDLCQQCYRKHRLDHGPRSLCCPEKPLYARGLCRNHYDASAQATATPPELRDVLLMMARSVK